MLTTNLSDNSTKCSEYFFPNQLFFMLLWGWTIDVTYICSSCSEPRGSERLPSAKEWEGRTVILFIDACARKGSRSRELAEAALSYISEEDPEVEKVCLYDCDLKPLTENMIEARNDALNKNDYSGEIFNLSRQFAGADIIIMAVPYWDLSFPAILKLYLEAVSVNGVTFTYDDKGVPHGMCKATKLYYVTTAGGEIGNNNYGYEYVKALTRGLFGVADTKCIRAVGLDMENVDARRVLENAKSQLRDILLC